MENVVYLLTIIFARCFNIPYIVLFRHLLNLVSSRFTTKTVLIPYPISDTYSEIQDSQFPFNGNVIICKL